MRMFQLAILAVTAPFIVSASTVDFDSSIDQFPSMETQAL